MGGRSPEARGLPVFRCREVDLFTPRHGCLGFEVSRLHVERCSLDTEGPEPPGAYDTSGTGFVPEPPVENGVVLTPEGGSRNGSCVWWIADQKSPARTEKYQKKIFPVPEPTRKDLTTVPDRKICQNDAFELQMQFRDTTHLLIQLFRDAGHTDAAERLRDKCILVDRAIQEEMRLLPLDEKSALRRRY